MPRIQPVDTQLTDSNTAASLEAVRRSLGMLPNLHATFAQSPALLQAYLGYADAIGKGRLKPVQRELIALVIGQANGCQYCLSAHSLLGKGAGLNAEALLAARAGRAADTQDQAVLSLALALLEQRGRLSDEQLASAHGAGLDDGLILEVLGQVAMNVLTNFGNNLAQTTVDFPPVAVEI